MRRLCATTMILMVGCAARADAHRYAALWSETRPLAAPPSLGDAEPALADASGALDRGALVAAVLARNPDVAAARDGLRAALAEVDRAGALDDPSLAYQVAPLSVAGDAPFGQ
ncbi:MAG TPA: hypothetical protein VHE35_36765, partial [Kofleriaceae bacterium]|nr:hypothetical protein [Kofleriaceae bacterium]